MQKQLITRTLAALILITALAFAMTAQAAVMTWTGASGSSWSTAGNWNPSTPGVNDTALFNNTSSNLSTTLDAAFSIDGIQLTDVGGGVSVADGTGGPLTLGTGGVDMSSATANLTFSNAIDFSANTTFDVTAGRTVTLNGMATNSQDIQFDGGGVFFQNSLSYSGWSGDTYVTEGGVLRFLDQRNSGSGNDFGTGDMIFSNSGTIRIEQLSSAGSTRSMQKGIQVGNAGQLTFDIRRNGKSVRTFNFTGPFAGGEDITVVKSANGSNVRLTNTSSGTSWTGSLDLDIGSGTLSISRINAPNATRLTLTGGNTLSLAGSSNFSYGSNLQFDILGGSRVRTGGDASASMLGNSSTTVTLAGAEIYSHDDGSPMTSPAFDLYISGSSGLRHGRDGGPGSGQRVAVYSGMTYLAPGTELNIANDPGFNNSDSSLTLIGIQLDQLTTQGGHVQLNILDPVQTTAPIRLSMPDNGSNFTLAPATTFSATLGSTAEWQWANTGLFVGTDNVMGRGTVGDDIAVLSGSNIVALSTYTALPTTGGSADTAYEATGSVTTTGGLSANTIKLNNASTGTLDLNGNTLSFQSGGLLHAGTADYAINNGLIDVSAGSNPQDYLYVHQRSTSDLTIGAAITGSAGLAKTGTGQLNLSGTNTYSGDTYVNQGTLAMSGSGTVDNTGVITVHEGATFSISGVSGGSFSIGGSQTLAGNGTVALGGNDLTVTGSVSPGLSAGELTFTSTGGSVVMDTGSALLIEISGTEAGDFDTIVLDGAEFVAGGTLEFSNLLSGQPAIGTTLQIFDASAGTLSGSFDSILNTDLGNYYYWDTANLLTDGTIIAAVPEPASLTLLALGGCLLLRRRRMRG